MKKNSLKKSITTGVLAASLLSTSAFAFASTDAGAQLKLWADKQVANAKGVITASLPESITNAKAGVSADINEKQNAAVDAVNQAATDEKAQTASAINAKLQEHLGSLDAALTEFKGKIGGDFDAFVGDKNAQTYSSMDNQLTQLTAQVESVMAATQSAAVEDITENSLLVKGEATAALIDKINDVKDQLSALIASEQALAQGEVDAYLADQVTSLTVVLTNLINELEADAKAAIEAAGAAAETEAEAAFNVEIGKINN